MFFKSTANFGKKGVGAYGEKLACKFLKKFGYKIIDKNYRTRAGEIDIIAKDKESFVFIEVKTRSGTQFGYPEINVHPKKLQNFTAASQVYILQNKIASPFRLDAISVDISHSPPEIKHFRNITL